MVKLFKKLIGLLLVVTIVFSSIGLTIVNHICKIENEVYTGIEEVGKYSTCHNDGSANVCNSCQSQSCCTEKGGIPKGITIKDGSQCCYDIKHYSKVEVVSNEKSLKKFSGISPFVQKVNYVKESIDQYFTEKTEKIKIIIIDPIRKIIKFIRFCSKVFTPSGEEALL